MEIIRDYATELRDMEIERQEAIVIRAIKAHIITDRGGRQLLGEIYGM